MIKLMSLPRDLLKKNNSYEIISAGGMDILEGLWEFM